MHISSCSTAAKCDLDRAAGGRWRPRSRRRPLLPAFNSGGWRLGTNGTTISELRSKWARQPQAPAALRVFGRRYFTRTASSPRRTRNKHVRRDLFGAVPASFLVRRVGNHDYRGVPQAQIDYAKASPRWRMLSRYFKVASADIGAASGSFTSIPRPWFTSTATTCTASSLRMSPARYADAAAR